MRILSLELTNIKSYHEPTRIEFTNGLNAVCGSNGSGKTTLLEAIGYALFDFLPYNRLAFVREAEKTGTIRLRFLANDDREYEVVRKVGAGAQHYVIDPETEIKLADRGPDVLAWVQTHALGVDAQTDMESLFKNAVGVPQGLMTSDFLGTASVRKSIFDPLLRVEEYRQAFDNLRETLNYVRDRTAHAEVEIARLEAETDRIPALVEAVESHRERVEAGAAQCDTLAAQLAVLEARRSELEAAQRRIMQLDGDLQGARYDVTRFDDAARQAEALLQSARAAHRAVVESEPGYMLYRAAEGTLKELDARRADRDGLRASLAKVKGELDGTRRQIARLEGDLKGAHEAGMAAAALTADVDRQIALEREQHEVAAVLRGLPDLEKRLTAAAAEIRDLERQKVDRESRLLDARAAQRDAEGLPAARDRTGELHTKLALREPMEAQLASVKAQGKALKEQAMRLTDDVQQRDRLVAECAPLRPVAERLETLQQELQDLRDERARAKASIDYQDVARRSLERRTCPLLELQCPVVSADGSVLDRFGSHTLALRDRLAETEESLGTLAAEVSRSQDARRAVQSLEVRIAKLDGSEERAADVRTQLDECIARHDEIARSLAKQPGLKSEYVSAMAEQQRLEERARLGDLVPEIESALVAASTRLTVLEHESHDLVERRSLMATMQELLETVKRELAGLGDVRARQSALLGEAARQADLDTALQRERVRHAEEDAAYRAFTEQLLPFETLDDEIARVHDVIETHRPAYEIYLQQGPEAAQVGERETALEEAKARCSAAVERERAVAAEREAAGKEYAAGEHADIEVRYRDTGEQLSARRTTLQRDRLDLQSLDDELARLRIQEGKLAGWLAERGELGAVAGAMAFIRETIKAAGPAVTETLLAHISQGANDIFAEIMDDHTVELRWDRDYEVLAQRGAEVRRFNQLSGGEQMSAALAVRLALLKEMSEVDFAFFDEPTQNMDGERRTNLANQISEIRGFDQLIVISHDDTFEHHTENLIRLSKTHEETRLEPG